MDDEFEMIEWNLRKAKENKCVNHAWGPEMSRMTSYTGYGDTIFTKTCMKCGKTQSRRVKNTRKVSDQAFWR
jgi:hypothetical protein